MKRTALALTYFLTLSTARSAEILIDDFSGTLAPTGTFAFLDGTMLGGEMEFSPIVDVGETLSLQVASGSAQFSGVTGSVRAILQWDGNENDSGLNFGLGPVDLTDGWTNDRFEIEFGAVSAPLAVKVRIFESIAKYAEYDTTVSAAGTLTVAFDDLVQVDTMNPASLANVSLILLAIDADTGETWSISEFRATGPPVPDTTAPTIRISGANTRRTGASQITLRGTATDNVGVARVEIKEGSRGFRRVNLKANNTWSHRSARLTRNRTVFVARCTDLSGNRSAQDRVTVIRRD
jgi:hypothetical protein